MHEVDAIKVLQCGVVAHSIPQPFTIQLFGVAEFVFKKMEIKDNLGIAKNEFNGLMLGTKQIFLIRVNILPVDPACDIPSKRQPCS